MFTLEEKELCDLISPYAKWSRPEETIDIQKNEEARQILLRFYENLSMKKIDPIYRNSITSRGHMEYIFHLYQIREALVRGAYPVACHEIVSFLYHEPFFQGRNMANIMLLLGQYLNIEEDTVMHKSKFRGRNMEPIADEKYTLGLSNTCYRSTLDFINTTLESKERLDRETLLEYYMIVIRQDIQNDYLTALLYQDENYDRNITPLFPAYYFDKAGNTVNLLKETYQLIDLVSNDCTVISFPWRQNNRLVDSILGLFKKRFEFHKNNFEAIYYKSLGVVCVMGGKHSILEDNVKREGQIPVQEYDISKLFQHVGVNGEGRKWINLHTGENIGNVQDFRVALLYKLAEIKESL